MTPAAATLYGQALFAHFPSGIGAMLTSQFRLIGFSVLAALCILPSGFAAAQEPLPSYWLGVLVEPNPDEEGTVRVLEIVPDSPASKSTLKPGDVLKSANGKKLSEAGALLAAISDAGGKEIELVVGTGSGESKVKITPEK